MTTHRHWRFRPGPIPTAAAVLAIALTVYLGQWQQGRAAEKRALQAVYLAREGAPVLADMAELAATGLEYRRASLLGAWLPAGQAYVDNKSDGGRAGYHVVTPLVLAGGGEVLVNRGWIARSVDYPRPPAAEPPAGTVRVEGRLVTPSARFMELGPQAVEGSVWQNLTIERYRERTGRAVAPYLLVAASAPAPLKPVEVKPDAGIDKHVEYMLTWYTLAVTVAVLWVALNLRRVPSHQAAPVARS